MNHYTNSTYLNTVIDEFFNTCYNYHNTGNGTGFYPNTITDFTYTILQGDKWKDIVYNHNFASKPQTPKYPKTSGYFKQDGTMIIEVATTGFEKDEIKVKREGEKITVTGKQKDSGLIINTDENTRKVIWQDISQKAFEIFFTFDDKMDLNNISLKMNNGLLEISVPMKEEHRPVVKELEIK